MGRVEGRDGHSGGDQRGDSPETAGRAVDGAPPTPWQPGEISDRLAYMADLIAELQDMAGLMRFGMLERMLSLSYDEALRLRHSARPQTKVETKS